MLSKTSKMPCKSWSLEAVTHCPASKGKDGELVPACSGCYAAGGFYKMPAARNLRAHNAADWKRAGWVSDMVAAIGSAPYFRWFDSGDMYALKLARKIEQVIARTPDTRHWLPTRMHKFPKFGLVLADIQALPNATVRYSSDSVSGEIIAGECTSTIIADGQNDTTATVCRAYERGGKCGDCRACWDRSVQVIAYVAHGRAMARVIASG